MKPKKQSSQSQSASLDPGKVDRLANNVVMYLLIMDQKKMPIKKADINRNVLKEDSKAFATIIREAGERLEKVFGIELHELEDKQKGSFILVSSQTTEPEEETHIQWTEESDCKNGLLMIVLGLIFMMGNVITDSQLWSALKKVGVEKEVSHDVFGDVKKLILTEWVRQCYIEVYKQPNTDPPVSEIRWGQRAFLETSKREILEVVSKIYDIEDISQWTSQYADVQRSENPATDPQPTTS